MTPAGTVYLWSRSLVYYVLGDEPLLLTEQWLRLLQNAPFFSKMAVAGADAALGFAWPNAEARGGFLA